MIFVDTSAWYAAYVPRDSRLRIYEALAIDRHFHQMPGVVTSPSQR